MGVNPETTKKRQKQWSPYNVPISDNQEREVELRKALMVL